jgi:Ni,Fe-hydrogenase III small subunit
MMWQNIVKPGRPPMTIWHMRIAGCIPKPTNILSEYVMLFALFTATIFIRTLLCVAL